MQLACEILMQKCETEKNTLILIHYIKILPYTAEKKHIKYFLMNCGYNCGY